MVRFVMAIGILALLGFMLYCFLPVYNALNEVINGTTINATALELAQYNLLPFAIAGLVLVCVVWYYFKVHGKGGGEE